MKSNNPHRFGKHKKKKAKGEPYRYRDQFDVDEDMILNSCSMYDCTGLIPSAPVNEAELDSYEQIYQYLPPDSQ